MAYDIEIENIYSLHIGIAANNHNFICMYKASTNHYPTFRTFGSNLTNFPVVDSAL
jgi:hypothetical protein